LYRKFGWRYEIMFHGLCHLVDDSGNAKNKICPECDTPFKVQNGLLFPVLITEPVFVNLFRVHESIPSHAKLHRLAESIPGLLYRLEIRAQQVV
jgi:hypothetical protein